MSTIALHLAGLAVALCIAIGAIGRHLDHARQQNEILEALQNIGLSDLDPTALQALQVEEDSRRAAELAARIVLARDLDEVKRRLQHGLDPGFSDPQQPAGLAQVVRWASEGLATRPSSWNAAALLGTARFLDAWQSGSAVAQRKRWEAPLQLAHRLSPGQPEPLRLLASAYIRSWAALPADNREAPLAAIRRAFGHRENLEELVDEWLDAEPTLQEILGAMPDALSAWRTLVARFQQAGDHERIAAAAEGMHGARLREIDAALELASQQHRSGAAEGMLHRAFDMLRPSQPTLPNQPAASLLDRALKLLHPSSLQPSVGADLRGWLDWAIERCLIGACPISPDAFRRLPYAIPDLDPVREAAAQLAAGHLRRAERLRARNLSGNEPGWSAVSLLLADHLSREGRNADALEALATVDVSWHTRAAYWQIHRQVSERAASGDPELWGLPDPRASIWNAERWSRPDRRRQRLELVPAREASGILVSVASVPPSGASLVFSLDAQPVQFLGLSQPGEVRIGAPLDRAVHVLEVELLSGRWPEFGTVRLQGET